jgi:uncharacterized protein YpmS
MSEPALILSVAAVAASFVWKSVTAWLNRRKPGATITIKAGDKSISVQTTGSTEEDLRKLVEVYIASSKAEKSTADGDPQ